MQPSTIGGINHLPDPEKREIYLRIVPPELLALFPLDLHHLKEPDCDLLHLYCPPGSAVADMELYHQIGFRDPILHGEITDTQNGQIHVLLYILNDPAARRFDVDCLPDGTSTRFGTQGRNLPAELAAIQFGLTPGQIRRGLRMLGPAIRAFENFVQSLGHDLYFVEPLYYHNAILFERHGFAYERGRKLMERIRDGFEPGGDLQERLDGSTPFRRPGAEKSVRLRSWAIHDGLLGEPFTSVTMYKRIGKPAGMNTCPDCTW